MKTRLTAAVLLVLAACTGCTPTAAAPPAATDTPAPIVTSTIVGDTILFAQDSVGYGLNATAVDRGFRPLVTAGLTERAPTREVTYGKPGYTVEETSALVVAPTDLDYAVIELGSNDANQGLEQSTFASQYNALLERIFTASPDVKLVCLGTLATYRDSATFDTIIQSVCDAAGGTFISIADITADPVNLSTVGAPVWGGQHARDAKHPNDTGHALIAERILATLLG